MEIGDPSVSLDLLVRSLLALGASTIELSRIISARRRAPAANAIDDDGRAHRARRALRGRTLFPQSAGWTASQPQRMRCGGRRGPAARTARGLAPLDHRIGHFDPASDEAQKPGHSPDALAVRVLTDLEVQILRSNPLQHAVLDSRRDRHDGLEPDALGREGDAAGRTARRSSRRRRVTAGAPSRPTTRSPPSQISHPSRNDSTNPDAVRRLTAEYCDIAANPSRSPRGARVGSTQSVRYRGPAPMLERDLLSISPS